jgi:hypothetical protein
MERHSARGAERALALWAGHGRAIPVIQVNDRPAVRLWAAHLVRHVDLGQLAVPHLERRGIQDQLGRFGRDRGAAARLWTHDGESCLRVLGRVGQEGLEAAETEAVLAGHDQANVAGGDRG